MIFKLDLSQKEMKRLDELKSTVKGLDARGTQWKLTNHAIIYLTIAWAIDSEAMRARGIIALVKSS